MAVNLTSLILDYIADPESNATSALLPPSSPATTGMNVDNINQTRKIVKKKIDLLFIAVS